MIPLTVCLSPYVYFSSFFSFGCYSIHCLFVVIIIVFNDFWTIPAKFLGLLLKILYSCLVFVCSLFLFLRRINHRCRKSAWEHELHHVIISFVILFVGFVCQICLFWYFPFTNNGLLIDCWYCFYFSWYHFSGCFIAGFHIVKVKHSMQLAPAYINIIFIWYIHTRFWAILFKFCLSIRKNSIIMNNLEFRECIFTRVHEI